MEAEKKSRKILRQQLELLIFFIVFWFLLKKMDKNSVYYTHESSNKSINNKINCYLRARTHRIIIIIIIMAKTRSTPAKRSPESTIEIIEKFFATKFSFEKIKRKQIWETYHRIAENLTVNIDLLICIYMTYTQKTKSIVPIYLSATTEFA